MGLRKSINTGGLWTNWAGNQRSRPSHVQAPTSLDELKRVVRDAQSVRVTGAGHSFSPIAKTSGTLITLDGLSGVISVNAEKHEATVFAGSRLRPLGDAFSAHGLALINQGDIDHQSIAGGLSTGTHGTGIELGCLASALTGAKLILADGSELNVSAADADMLDAVRVSLGALGVVAELSLQVMPSYRLLERTAVQPLSTLIKDIDTLKHKFRHIELWAFPFGDTAIVKTLEPTHKPADLLAVRSGWSDDISLYLSCQLTRVSGAAKRWVQKNVANFVSSEEHIGESRHIFPSERRVRFVEMEYQIPAASGPACLDEVVQAIRKSDLPVMFPIEYRYVAQDSGWLSPFFTGPKAAISIHQFASQDEKPLFDLCEPIFQKYSGVPHWGKMHSMKAEDLALHYPRFRDFQRLRAELDPSGKFLSPDLQQLFDSFGLPL